MIRTIYDRRNKLTKEVSDQLSAYFPNKVYKTIVPRNVRIAEAPSHGQSAIQFDKRSKGAKAYLELAEELLRKKEGFNYVKEKRLGRGLSAYLNQKIEEDQVQEKPLKGEMIENISVDQLNPGQYQPRKTI